MPSRHGHQGGGRRGAWHGDHGCWLLLQRDAHGGGGGFRDASPLCEGGPRAGRGVTEGAECRQHHREEDMHPLRGFALDHPQ